MFASLNFKVADAGKAHQRLVHFIDVGRRRPRLLAHRADGVGVQCSEIVGGLRIAPAPVDHRLRAAFFQRCVVEKGVGPRAEDFCRQWRGRRQVATDQSHLAALHAPQQMQPALAVHGLVQAVIEGLFHQRMFRDFPFAGEVFQAGDLVREHARDQVFAFHSLQLRRDFAPAGKARQRQRHPGIPAPAHAEQRRVENRLNQEVLGAVAVQVTPDVIQFETVAGGQRQDDRIFAGSGLQFEVEGATETLAQGQAPGAVDAAAERRMDDQLGAAGLVEKPLHQQRVL